MIYFDVVKIKRKIQIINHNISLKSASLRIGENKPYI